MEKESIWNVLRGIPRNQKLIIIGIIILLTIGALGATTNIFSTQDGSLLASAAEKIGLKEPAKSNTSYQPANPPTGPLQLSKEYVYAGSRTLSVEDYGVVPANPSPTPAGGTPTPTPTPGQPPTTPSIASVAANADPTCLNITINAVSGAVSYNVKLVANGYTINVTQTSFPWCGLTPNTYYEFQAQAANTYGTSGWSNPVGGTTAQALAINLTVNSTSITTGNIVTANWSANQNRPSSDYIGFYAVGAPNNSPLLTQNIAGGLSGTYPVTINAAGSYEFRYFIQGESTPRATSPTITATTPETYTLSNTCFPAPPTGQVCDIYWTASVNRPANVDKVTVSFQANPSLIALTMFTSGGTSGKAGRIPFNGTPLVLKYWKDGTTVVATKNLP